MKKKGIVVEPGRFYGRVTEDGPLMPAPPGRPDVWICRRVADYPDRRVPTGAAVATCTDCHASIAFNPARSVSAPKVCMQCAGIQPLPIE